MGVPEILLQLLSNFGHSRYRNEVQEKAIHVIVERENDVYISMPTGSGKSLCFQLPAVFHRNKIAIVFSPLIALMKDQIDHLRKCRVNAVTINSKMSDRERTAVLDSLRAVTSTIQLLYVAPEQLKTQTFTSVMNSLYATNMISYIVVDEAHCVSEWGHDFRSDYLKLALLKFRYPNIPWVVLTATASPTVEKDIIEILNLDHGLMKFKIPCYRHNLYYDVVFRDTLEDDIEHLCEYVYRKLAAKPPILDDEKAWDGVGIIYCRTREMTEIIAHELTERGIDVKAYHGGLSPRERTQVQDEWVREKYPIISATVSFGMGIDKANVRCVVHWGVPQSLAAYYQESGRAGRDGKLAHCRLYYSKEERDKVDYLLRSEVYEVKSPEKREKAEAAYNNFRKMVRYCEEVSCRHAMFARFFGDAPPRCHRKCDVCVNPAAVQREIDKFYMKMMQYRTAALNRDTDDEGDLYGGGRQGARMERNDYYSDQAGPSDESRAKRELEAVIKRQFQVRKADESSEEDDSDLERNSSVKAARSTRVKVNGLKIGVRESFVNKIKELLLLNLSNAEDEESGNIREMDCEKYALELEYRDFSSTKVITMYRRAMIKTTTEIKKYTSENRIHPIFIQYKPEQNPEAGKFSGFVKASDMIGKGKSNIPGQGKSSNPMGKGKSNIPGQGKSSNPIGKGILNEPDQGKSGNPIGKGKSNIPGQGKSSNPIGKGISNEPGQGNSSIPMGKGKSNIPGQGNSSIPMGKGKSNIPGQGNSSNPMGKGISNIPGQGNLSSPMGKGISNIPGQGNLSIPMGKGKSNIPGQGKSSNPMGKGISNIPGQGNLSIPMGKGKSNIPGQGNLSIPMGKGISNEPGPRKWNEPGPSKWNEPGPSKWNEPGPSKWNEPGPSKWNEPGPSKWNEPGPSKWNEPGPSKWNEPGPSKWNEPGPSKWNEPGPNKWNEPGPSKWNEPGPSKWNEPGPSKWNEPGPSKWNEPGPSKWNEPGPSKWNEPGPSKWNEPGPRKWNEPGPSKWNEPGPSKWNEPGPSKWNEPGPSKWSEPQKASQHYQQKKVSDYFMPASSSRSEADSSHRNWGSRTYEAGGSSYEHNKHAEYQRRNERETSSHTKDDGGKRRSSDDYKSPPKKPRRDEDEDNVKLKPVNLYEDDEEREKVEKPPEVMSKEKVIERNRVTDLVIKHLMPAYRLKKFIRSRAQFKSVAREISKSLLEKDCSNTSDTDVYLRVQDYFQRMPRHLRCRGKIG